MDDIMIALLPINSEWSTLSIPHLTLVYSGKISDHSPIDFNSMVKDAISLAMISKPIILDVTGVEQLGPPEDLVKALMFKPSTELMAMRHFVESWDHNKYPEYKPHATMGPYYSTLSTPIPSQVCFDRIMVGWGEDAYNIWLRKDY